MAIVNSARGRRALSLAFGAAFALACLLWPVLLRAQAEPAACRSSDPRRWPAPAKPYFMLAVDTSGSMTECVNGRSASLCDFDPANNSTSSCNGELNSCGLPATRLNGAKCALQQTIQAFAGQVNFGLASFGGVLSSCPANCSPCPPGVKCDCREAAGGYSEFDDDGEAYRCNVTPLPNAMEELAGCGNRPQRCSANSSGAFPSSLGTGWSNGGNILVPLQQDGAAGSNVPELLQWFDGSCREDRELWALGNTPLEGILNTVRHYLTVGWDPRWGSNNYCRTNPFGTGTYPMFATPIPGLADGTRAPACRSLNVVLLTDGIETCSGNTSAGVTPAAALRGLGVRTHVIGFQVSGTSLNEIAAAGGTRTALSASDEVQLATALSSVIGGAIRPEVCDNVDNDCNGCTDEGFRKYCNRNKTPSSAPTNASQCCQWSTSTQRDACSNAFRRSITAENPQGNRWLLPCWSPGNGETSPQTRWLCTDPGEICDDRDNNCDAEFEDETPGVNRVDEGFDKCGSPLVCPAPETCNGRDDDCDNIVDNARGSLIASSACPSDCNVTAEICDGCDNDCDGVADEDIPPVACGLQSPPNCSGTRSCAPIPGVGINGCAPGGNAYGACTWSPASEICDGADNDCDGQPDDGVAPVACDVPGRPGLVYRDTFAASRCVRGTLPCRGTCSGYVGPSDEICNGIDDDCDGAVDDGVPNVGGSCQAQCGAGAFVCEGGVFFCRGDAAPQPEVCDGRDNDCNGSIDDGPLLDAPPTPGCWTLSGDACASSECGHANARWCAPAGATCTALGGLTEACHVGRLSCEDGVWACRDDRLPTPEICDGADNDCDGVVDEDQLEVACGPTSDAGRCEFGTQRCVDGALSCHGAVYPRAEECNGLDDDCDGVVDEDAGVGQACRPEYDTQAYPGARERGGCQPGVAACATDGSGQRVCLGGVGPAPELCDGFDNDCDGATDEAGPAPDGVTGTADESDPTRVLGQPCGIAEGVCTMGRYVCNGGRVTCSGSVGAQVEVCNCLDDDCDGLVDEDPAPSTGICGGGESCVALGSGACQCAPRCGSGEFPCPVGASCTPASPSGDGSAQPGDYCVNDRCGDCSSKTARDAHGAIVCAPSTSGLELPECVCSATGCVHPCTGQSCPPDEACVQRGAFAGSCYPSGNCFVHGCSAGAICANGSCVPQPCRPGACAEDEVCKPTSSYDEVRCVASCAGVTCAPGERCVEGTCEPTGCSGACAPGLFCRREADGFVCGESLCDSTWCDDGRACEPTTGQCVTPRCTGVVCPAEQVCVEGECVEAPRDPAGSGGASSGGASAMPDASAAGATGGGAGSGDPTSEPQRGRWGVATGGGGCSCGTARSRPSAGLTGLGLAAALLLARRGWRPPGRSGSRLQADRREPVARRGAAS